MARSKLWLFLVLVLLAGCGGDDEVSGPVVSILPDSKPSLLSDFVHLYEAMDSDHLADIIHPDAKVFLTDSALQEFEQAGHPLDFTCFDRDSLLAVHDKLFSGAVGHDGVGNPTPPVVDIAFELIEQVGVWEAFDDTEGDFPGLDVEVALFQVVLHFNNPDFHRYEVRSDVVFFATGVPQGQGTGWQLLGWRELEPVAPPVVTERIFWSDILLFYR
jgi:hypothetical protein